MAILICGVTHKTIQLDDTAYCHVCDERVFYSVKNRKKCANIRNKKFSFIEHYALCDNCGNEIYVPTINDCNTEHRKLSFERSS